MSSSQNSLAQGKEWQRITRETAEQAHVIDPIAQAAVLLRTARNNDVVEAGAIAAAYNAFKNESLSQTINRIWPDPIYSTDTVLERSARGAVSGFSPQDTDTIIAAARCLANDRSVQQCVPTTDPVRAREVETRVAQQQDRIRARYRDQGAVP